MKPRFSIIICLYAVNSRFYKDLNKYLDLKYKNFEIILVTEKKAKILPLSVPVRIVRAKKEKISLGEKRDIGIKAARGEFCAFIDDDAYPDPEWLSNSLRIFVSDQNIGAVGGPNLMPEEDIFWEKIGGYIYESYLTSGEAQYRFLRKKRRIVTELQGVNLIVRKEILDKLGGFKSRLYSGDDSKICSNIRSMGYKIVYDPNVFVFHHRRAFPLKHLKQIRNMGTHRGFFVKAFPDTLSIIYFLPSVLTVGFLLGLILAIFVNQFRLIFAAVFVFFFVLGFLSVYKRAGLIKSFFVSIGIILTHITYGLFFIKGFFTKSVERQNE